MVWGSVEKRHEPKPNRLFVSARMWRVCDCLQKLQPVLYTCYFDHPSAESVFKT